jgi:predicted nucleic acid-binding protein
MDLYAESSAVLAWLFREPSEEGVKAALGQADSIVASHLTVVESERALVRAVSMGRLTESEGADRRAQLASVVTRWNLLRLEAEVMERAGRRFPGEPLRTLDALHLASALAARAAVPGLAMLSLDGRVRRSATELGFDVIPEV